MALQTHLFNVLPDIFETAMNQPKQAQQQHQPQQPSCISNRSDETPHPAPSASAPTPSGIHQDVVALKNLQLPFGLLAPDVWGNAKEQPVLASITLLLRDQGFDYAAQNDVIVPGATIHYGDLAKRVRAACAPEMSVDGLSKMIEKVIVELATSSSTAAAGGGGGGQSVRCLVARASIELNLPKAAMFGDLVKVVSSVVFDDAGRAQSVRRVFTVADVKVMTLVGVHPYERTATQPLVVTLSLFWDDESDAVLPSELFRLEQMLAQILQDTSFDTLETLAGFIVAQLSDRLLSKLVPGAHIQLRIEKPRAIAFADAPVIEILRTIPGSKNTSQQQDDLIGEEKVDTVSSVAEKRTALPRFVVSRPYVDRS